MNCLTIRVTEHPGHQLYLLLVPRDVAVVDGFRESVAQEPFVAARDANVDRIIVVVVGAVRGVVHEGDLVGVPAAVN